MSNRMTAEEALRKYQKQCDNYGCEVQVSRQALDEVLDRLDEIRKISRDSSLSWQDKHIAIWKALEPLP